MVGYRAVVVMVGVAIGLTAWVVPLGARGGPVRTPAEIELRRAEIAERLVAIDRELAALDARLNDLARLSAAADADASITLALQQQDGEARREAFAGEQTTLLEERAVLAAIVTRIGDRASAAGRSPRPDVDGPLSPGRSVNSG